MFRKLRSAKWVTGTRHPKFEHLYGFAYYEYRTERSWFFVWGRRAWGWQWVG